VIKSRILIWEGCVARIGEMRNVYRILVVNVKGRDRLGDLGIDERMILK
jgi:hypothetical protein